MSHEWLNFIAPLFSSIDEQACLLRKSPTEGALLHAGRILHNQLDRLGPGAAVSNRRLPPSPASGPSPIALAAGSIAQWQDDPRSSSSPGLLAFLVESPATGMGCRSALWRRPPPQQPIPNQCMPIMIAASASHSP
jgi:hypothetical protein